MAELTISQIPRDPREANRERNRRYQERHKERLRERRQQNRDKKRERDKQYHESHKEECNERSRQYYLKHRDRIKANTRQWRITNSERVKAFKSKNYQKNKERWRIRYKERYKKYKEQIKQRVKQWNTSPHGKSLRRIYATQRQARKRAKGSIQDRIAILAYYKFVRRAESIKCHWCKQLVKRLDRRIDHIIPLAKGGPHLAINLCCACKNCNASKHTQLPQEISQQGFLSFS
jgi:hypothetical protein